MIPQGIYKAELQLLYSACKLNPNNDLQAWEIKDTYLGFFGKKIAINITTITILPFTDNRSNTTSEPLNLNCARNYLQVVIPNQTLFGDEFQISRDYQFKVIAL